MDYQERVLYIVRNYIEFGRYGRDEGRAVRRIHQHHPDVPLPVCRETFIQYVKAYTGAVSLVQANRGHYGSIPKDLPAGEWVQTREEEEWIRNNGDFPVSLVLPMIRFIFDWHHVR